MPRRSDAALANAIRLTAPDLASAPSPRSRARSNGRRRRADVVTPPLGSLTQRDHRHTAFCVVCGSLHVTRLTMNLTDGTQVEFTSCHRCEHRRWESDGLPLSRQRVLDSTRKPEQAEAQVPQASGLSGLVEPLSSRVDNLS